MSLAEFCKPDQLAEANGGLRPLGLSYVVPVRKNPVGPDSNLNFG
jgi:hypothetical protein